MVRRLVGTLVEVGRGSLTVEEFKSLVEVKSSRNQPTGFHVAAHTAPPSGLFLERIVYGKSERMPPLAAAFPVRKV
jgi:tRNA pseudouridine38-40 synthase